MNITELARRLRVRPEELREKLPLLGFAVGKKGLIIFVALPVFLFLHLLKNKAGYL